MSVEPASVRSEPTDERTARTVLAVLFVLTCVGLAVGLWGWAPYLEREHRRLEPWKAVLLWVGDITTLAWFTWYCIDHILRRRPFEPRRARTWSFALFSILFALACDLAVTVALILDERAAYQSAVETDGQVTAVAVKTFQSGIVKYDLTYRFLDRAGEWHTARYTVRSRPGEGFPPEMPREVDEALRAGRRAFPVRVSYHPNWPNRSWVRGTGWDDADRLHYFSLLPLLFQLIGLLVFILLLRAEVQRTGTSPWWHDLYKVFPLMVEAAVFVLFGALELSEQTNR